MTHAAVMYARDLDRLVEFYTAHGLTVDEAQRGDYAVLTGPHCELSILQIPKHVAAQIEIQSPPQPRETTPIKLVFVVSSIDEVLRVTGALGGRIKDGSKRWHFRGHAVQDAIDPEGNVYQLREPL
jgi:predicted enzyme related to lactoylglutathione lyase